MLVPEFLYSSFFVDWMAGLHIVWINKIYKSMCDISVRTFRQPARKVGDPDASFIKSPLKTTSGQRHKCDFQMSPVVCKMHACECTTARGDDCRVTCICHPHSPLAVIMPLHFPR